MRHDGRTYTVQPSATPEQKQLRRALGLEELGDEGVTAKKRTGSRSVSNTFFGG
jgi:hypothetical protein